MADGKWIDGVAASTPCIEAAHRVLSVRLDVVQEKLELALHHADEDPEHIHQLRVSTRRAGAALNIFRSFLPKKVRREARNMLQRIRRAAGEIRDWDVFLQFLGQWAAENQRKRSRAGVDFLTGYAMGRRAVGQQQLAALAADFPLAFEQLKARVLAPLESDADDTRTMIELARPVLMNQIAELEHAASQDLDDYDQLHQVRIQGKQLRYQMEVFAPCFPPAFREVHYAAIEEMQEILGRINDSQVAIERLTALSVQIQRVLPDRGKRYLGDLRAMVEWHIQQLPKERKNFQIWWQEWRKQQHRTALDQLLRHDEADDPSAS